MAYDERLAERIRELLETEPDISESKMFGGLAFLVAGNMVIAASREGGVLLRADPVTADAIVRRTHAEFAVMRGRPMDGWLRVAAEHLATRRQLAGWVSRAMTYARTLPPKPGRR